MTARITPAIRIKIAVVAAGVGGDDTYGWSPSINCGIGGALYIYKNCL